MSTIEINGISGVYYDCYNLPYILDLNPNNMSLYTREYIFHDIKIYSKHLHEITHD